MSIAKSPFEALLGFGRVLNLFELPRYSPVIVCEGLTFWIVTLELSDIVNSKSTPLLTILPLLTYLPPLPPVVELSMSSNTLSSSTPTKLCKLLDLEGDTRLGGVTLGA